MMIKDTASITSACVSLASVIIWSSGCYPIRLLSYIYNLYMYLKINKESVTASIILSFLFFFLGGGDNYYIFFIFSSFVVVFVLHLFSFPQICNRNPQYYLNKKIKHTTLNRYVPRRLKYWILCITCPR